VLAGQSRAGEGRVCCGGRSAALIVCPIASLDGAQTLTIGGYVFEEGPDDHDVVGDRISADFR
jgi:hypothetical protein